MLVLEHAGRVPLRCIGRLFDGCICAAESRVGDELAHADLDLGTAHLERLALCRVRGVGFEADSRLGEAAISGGKLLVNDEHGALETLLLSLLLCRRGFSSRRVVGGGTVSHVCASTPTSTPGSEMRTRDRLHDVGLTWLCAAVGDRAPVGAIASMVPLVAVAGCATVGTRVTETGWTPAGPTSWWNPELSGRQSSCTGRAGWRSLPPLSR